MRSGGKKLNINKMNVSLQLFAAGYCKHAEFVTIRGGSLRQAQYPAGFAAINHPVLGIMLFDTGYSERFHEQTSVFPYSIYAKITPVFLGKHESAARQLEGAQINPGEVKRIIISHFHADHIAGLRDFPNAQLICSKRAYHSIKGLTGIQAVRRGFVPTLLPDDFDKRCVIVDEAERIALPHGHPFPFGYDLFGDGSVIVVDLSGHADGQIGLFIQTELGEYFLCADAVWSSRAYRDNRPPHPIAGLIMPSRTEYRETFRRIVQLHKLYPQLQIIPSHCAEIERRIIKGEETL